MLPQPNTAPPNPADPGYPGPPSVGAAIEYLRGRTSGITLLTCYAHYFPAQWAASQATWTPDPECAWSAREWEFFRLVHTHLFPLNLDWLEILDDEGPTARGLELPIERGGLDWWEDQPGDFGPAWDLLLWLSGAWPSDEPLDDDPLDDDPLDDTPPDDTPPDDTPVAPLTADPATPYATEEARRLVPLLGRPVDPSRLEQAAAAAGPPLNGLPAALALIAHDTGSAWLDSGPEHAMDLYWGIADMAVMIDDYQRGKVIDDAAMALIDWLAHPAHRLQLLDLWATCLTPPPVGTAAA